MNKIGLIDKVRNGVSKARMVLGTNQSGVQRITGKYQREMFPRIFDAVLRLFLLLSQVYQDL